MVCLTLTDQIAAQRSNLKKLTKRFTNDQEESSDLVQETILKALLYKDSFRENTNLKAWLFTIMKNTFINNYRKNKRIKGFCDNSKELYILNVPDGHTFSSPEHGYEYQDIWRNVNELRSDLLIPFKLHTSGYKYHEIADHLRIPIGTVKNRIFQARKEIQAKLGGYSSGESASS